MAWDGAHSPPREPDRKGSATTLGESALCAGDQMLCHCEGEFTCIQGNGQSPGPGSAFMQGHLPAPPLPVFYIHSTVPGIHQAPLPNPSNPRKQQKTVTSLPGCLASRGLSGPGTEPPTSLVPLPSWATGGSATREGEARCDMVNAQGLEPWSSSAVQVTWYGTCKLIAEPALLLGNGSGDLVKTPVSPSAW